MTVFIEDDEVVLRVNISEEARDFLVSRRDVRGLDVTKTVAQAISLLRTYDEIRAREGTLYVLGPRHAVRRRRWVLNVPEP